jgi:hypothetical protein
VNRAQTKAQESPLHSVNTTREAEAVGGYAKCLRGGRGNPRTAQHPPAAIFPVARHLTPRHRRGCSMLSCPSSRAVASATTTCRARPLEDRPRVPLRRHGPPDWGRTALDADEQGATSGSGYTNSSSPNFGRPADSTSRVPFATPPRCARFWGATRPAPAPSTVAEPDSKHHLITDANVATSRSLYAITLSG